MLLLPTPIRYILVKVPVYEQKRREIREVEEMLGLRGPTSEDLASRAEWTEFVKNYKTHQFEIRESASTLRCFIRQLRIQGM